jgi:hypothetical protein
MILPRTAAYWYVFIYLLTYLLRASYKLPVLNSCYFLYKRTNATSAGSISSSVLRCLTVLTYITKSLGLKTCINVVCSNVQSSQLH